MRWRGERRERREVRWEREGGEGKGKLKGRRKERVPKASVCTLRSCGEGRGEEGTSNKKEKRRKEDKRSNKEVAARVV